MVKERSDKSKYTSPSTGEFCTCAQYVAELMCTRMAQRKNQGTQAYKFWNTEKWKKIYQFQVILANRLISKYSELALVKAVQSRELSRAYSLRHPKVNEVVRKHDIQVKLDASKIKKDLDVNESAETRKKSYGKRSKLNQLRNLDGKKDNN
tara:strand:+ start:370 stop:822 length:453 start_codon:yes stop_codon:yes gene_type:complete